MPALRRNIAVSLCRESVCSRNPLKRNPLISNIEDRIVCRSQNLCRENRFSFCSALVELAEANPQPQKSHHASQRTKTVFPTPFQQKNGRVTLCLPLCTASGKCAASLLHAGPAFSEIKGDCGFLHLISQTIFWLHFAKERYDFSP